MSANPETPGDDAPAEDVLFRPRTLESNDPYWDMPEGELATPEVSAEYRRRRRRRNVVQCLNLFGFAPLALWLGFQFIDNLGVRILFFTVAAAIYFYLQYLAQRAFRCPVCHETFLVLRQGIYNVSPRRREMLFSRFRWCEYCGTRFELYPPSAPDPPREDDGIL